MKRSSFPIHPMLLAVYPVLALLSHNVGQVRPMLGLRAVVLSVVGALGLLAVLRLVLHGWITAGLLASLAIVLFFSYGPAYELLGQVQVAGTSLGRHRYLAPLWIGLLIFGTFLVLRGISDPTRTLNVIALIAVAFPLVQLVGFELGIHTGPADVKDLDLKLVATDPMPNIYYIVLDAYGRQDVLLREFGVDNGEFVAQLEQMGFQVADCSMSNYSQTELTFSAVLNLNYLEELGDAFTADADDRSQMWPLIRDSQVRSILEDLGYQTVAFETGFRWSEFEDADIYLAPPRSGKIGLNAFEATLLRSTAAWAVLDQARTLPDFLARDFDQSAEQHYKRVKYVFDELKQSAELPGPKFVFAHIVAPHPPFVFEPNGDFRDPGADGGTPSGAEYVGGYRNQVIYLNDQLEKAIGRIVESSEVPPIIVLQGDHGPGHGSSTDRMSILNAILLPEGGEPISDSISPVNTFRLVLNSLFGADMLLLPDESYFSTYDSPYDFSVVPPACSSG